MSRNRRFRIIALLTVAVWTAAVGTLWRKRLAAKDGIAVTITTEPRLVRIQVKGDKTQPSGYIETPVSLTIAPGRRKVRISREGYRAHDMFVEGDPGDQINMGNVVLERDPNLELGKLSLKVDGGPIWFQLDDGLLRGEDSVDTDDVLIGVDHTLDVTLAAEPASGSRPVRCRIRLGDAQIETPMTISIRRLKGRNGKPDTIKVAPCDKLLTDKKRSRRQTTPTTSTTTATDQSSKTDSL